MLQALWFCLHGQAMGVLDDPPCATRVRAAAACCARQADAYGQHDMLW
jgi:hypothetical protein